MCGNPPTPDVDRARRAWVGLDALEPRLLLSATWLDQMLGDDIDVAAGEVRGVVHVTQDGDDYGESYEKAVPSATVYIDKDGDGVRDANEQSANTNANGVFVFTGLSTGKHTLRVEPGIDGDGNELTAAAREIELKNGQGVARADLGVHARQIDLKVDISDASLPDELHYGVEQRVAVLVGNEGNKAFDGKVLLRVMVSNRRDGAVLTSTAPDSWNILDLAFGDIGVTRTVAQSWHEVTLAPNRATRVWVTVVVPASLGPMTGYFGVQLEAMEGAKDANSTNHTGWSQRPVRIVAPPKSSGGSFNDFVIQGLNLGGWGDADYDGDPGGIGGTRITIQNGSGNVPTPGSISGVVFNDRDADGVQDPDEQGMAGVPVTLEYLRKLQPTGNLGYPLTPGVYINGPTTTLYIPVLNIEQPNLGGDVVDISSVSGTLSATGTLDLSDLTPAAATASDTQQVVIVGPVITDVGDTLTVITDEQGRYTFSNIDGDARYEVSIEPPQYYEFAPPYDGSHTVNVASDEHVEGINFGLFARPMIESLSSDSDAIAVGDMVTLTADGVFDADGEVTRVVFMRVRGDNPWLRLEPDSQDLLGVDTDGSDGYSITVPTDYFTGSEAYFFAVAQDDSGNLTDPNDMPDDAAALMTPANFGKGRKLYVSQYGDEITTLTLRAGRATALFDGADVDIWNLPGRTEVTGSPDIMGIDLRDTTPKSELLIEHDGRSGGWIGSITGSTPLGVLDADNMIISGIEMTGNGYILSTKIDEFHGDWIMPGGAANPRGIHIEVGRLGSMGKMTTMMVATHINSLHADQWRRVMLHAPSAERIDITGNAIGGRIMLYDTSQDAELEQLSVGRWLRGVNVETGSTIDQVDVGGMRQSRLMAGYTDLPAGGAFYRNRAIRSVKVHGIGNGAARFINSQLFAWRIGQLDLGRVTYNLPGPMLHGSSLRDTSDPLAAALIDLDAEMDVLDPQYLQMPPPPA